MEKMRTAVGLHGRVETRCWLTQEPPLSRRLDRRFLIQCDLGRGTGEIRIAGAAVAGAEHALLRDHGGSLDAPGLRRSRLQSLTRGRPRLHDVRVLLTDELRAVSGRDDIFLALVDMAVHVRENRLDALPGDIELLGDHHRDGCQGTLALLRVWDTDRHRTV